MMLRFGHAALSASLLSAARPTDDGRRFAFSQHRPLPIVSAVCILRTAFYIRGLISYLLVY